MGKSFKCLLYEWVLFLVVELFVITVNFVHVILDKLVLTVMLQIVVVVLRVLLAALGRMDEFPHRFQVQVRQVFQIDVCIRQKLDVADALLSLL